MTIDTAAIRARATPGQHVNDPREDARNAETRALCDALDAERTDNARLREMLGLAWDNVAKEQRALDAERAKVERLRVALRDTLEIAHSDDSDLPTGWTATLEAARAALEGE